MSNFWDRHWWWLAGVLASLVVFVVTLLVLGVDLISYRRWWAAKDPVERGLYVLAAAVLFHGLASYCRKPCKVVIYGNGGES